MHMLLQKLPPYLSRQVTRHLLQLLLVPLQAIYIKYNLQIEIYDAVSCSDHHIITNQTATAEMRPASLDGDLLGGEREDGRRQKPDGWGKKEFCKCTDFVLSGCHKPAWPIRSLIRQGSCEQQQKFVLVF